MVGYHLGDIGPLHEQADHFKEEIDWIYNVRRGRRGCVGYNQKLEAAYD